MKRMDLSSDQAFSVYSLFKVGLSDHFRIIIRRKTEFEIASFAAKFSNYLLVLFQL